MHITNNAFSGNITFPIAINGCDNGITVTGNDVSKLSYPAASFTSTTGCSVAVSKLVSNDTRLVAADILGLESLQSGFASAGNIMGPYFCGQWKQKSRLARRVRAHAWNKAFAG